MKFFKNTSLCLLYLTWNLQLRGEDLRSRFIHMSTIIARLLIATFSRKPTQFVKPTQKFTFFQALVADLQAP